MYYFFDFVKSFCEKYLYGRQKSGIIITIKQKESKNETYTSHNHGRHHRIRCGG